MPCKSLQGQLSLYAGRDLDPAAALLVGQHVRECPSCGEAVHGYEKTRTLLSSYARGLVDAPAGGPIVHPVVRGAARAPKIPADGG